MNERLTTALVSTAIIIFIIPIIGLIIDEISKCIAKALAKTVGVSITLFVMNYLTFIGTVHHELSHALYGFITGAKITKIELFKPTGTTLGQVKLVPRGNAVLRSFQLCMSAIAPTVQGLITECLLLKFFPAQSEIIWLKAIIVYVIVSIFIHMTMSMQDIKSALKGLPICMILVFIVCFAFNINIISMINSLVNTFIGGSL